MLPIHCVTSLICGICKIQQTSEYNKKKQITGAENNLVVAREEVSWGWVTQVNKTKRYKLPVIK